MNKSQLRTCEVPVMKTRLFFIWLFARAFDAIVLSLAMLGGGIIIVEGLRVIIKPETSIIFRLTRTEDAK